MNDLTPFDEITAKLPQLSPFQAVWNEAEELLRTTHPEGYEVEEIGRIAFDCLPEDERPAALDALFYCWWTALHADRERRAAYEAMEGQR
ncbi:hypothetical protein [Streptomyces swartbergensis]|uniref:Uncharacterized protein n=1 Tax=Streptomyces swartbergensis TaxID=487165 RepID=A0A243S8X2_9ACTN|nr:hypothetical protein [Streptomyces swartbergensis]OUD03371.1 hypothetical protein CA983_10195 [Streptomyces swartbergensis]